ERQHVEVDRAEFQENRLENRLIGVLTQAQQLHFLDQAVRVSGDGDIGDLCREGDEQQDVRDIELPDAAVDAHRGLGPAFAHHHPTVGDYRRVARDEDEDFGGIAEPVIAHGDPADDVVGNVVEIDEPQRQPAEQVEPDVASGNR